MRKVLVLRLSSLGDVVLTGPVFRNIRAAWPDAKVTALVKPQFGPILEGLPGVDEVMAWKGFFPTLAMIRSGGFTHFLDLHGTFRSFCLRRLSGVPEKAVYRKDALARRLFVWLRRRGPALEKHVLDRYLESLSAWRIPAVHRGLELPRSPLPSFPSTPMEAAPSRILVLQTAFLGDAALTLPLLKELRGRFPAARLAVLCRPDTAELFSGAADEIIRDDKRGADRGLSGLRRLARDLKGRGFDLAIVPHRSFRSALLAWAAGIPRRVGFDRSAGRFLFNRVVPFSWLMHDLERNLSLLGPVGGASAGPDADRTLLAGPPARRGIAERLKAAGRDERRPLVGIHPGSVWPTKRWLPERFADLIARLCRDAGAQVVLVGGRSDQELAASIRRASQAGGDCLDWTGQTSLPELIELMKELALFVTNDSGPMHVATASGVPTLALFGPTTRELGFFPYGTGHRVLEKDLACRPCGLHGARQCPEGHFLCMRLITTQEAYRAASEMLKAGRPQGAAR